jgi:hypothetical protein
LEFTIKTFGVPWTTWGGNGRTVSVVVSLEMMGELIPRVERQREREREREREMAG